MTPEVVDDSDSESIVSSDHAESMTAGLEVSSGGCFPPTLLDDSNIGYQSSEDPASSSPSDEDQISHSDRDSNVEYQSSESDATESSDVSHEYSNLFNGASVDGDDDSASYAEAPEYPGMINPLLTYKFLKLTCGIS